MKDPNYCFLQEITYTYLVALNLFRRGVRCDNSTAMLTGRQKFARLFYITGMTKYQEISNRDMTDRAHYPPELNEYIHATEAISVSGHPQKGEGGDFVLENKNKRLKTRLPTGVPVEKQWIRVKRNLDKLEEVSLGGLSLNRYKSHHANFVFPTFQCITSTVVLASVISTIGKYKYIHTH